MAIVYYPLWVARYVFRGRAYQVVIDGGNGQVLYGKAPGNIWFRAAALVVGMALGALAAVDGTALALRWALDSSDSDSLALVILPLVIGVGLMLAAYRRFRYGELIEHRLRGLRRPPVRTTDCRLAAQRPGIGVWPGTALVTAPVELVPLECLRCRTRLPAEEGEVAWICPACGQGQRLGEDAALIELDIRFADGSPEATVRWFPFWVLHGTVRILERLSYGGGQAPDPRWDASKQFILPAFETTPEEAAQWGTRFLREPVGLRAGAPGSLSGVTVSPEEAQSLAEFVVLSFEADRRDKLKSLRAVLDLGPPELWCLPFAVSGSGSRLALAKA